MVKVCASISFWASGIKWQIAARALRHPGHLLATLANSVLKYPTGCGVGPQSLFSTPRASPIFSYIDIYTDIYVYICHIYVSLSLYI
jgi:hypothetical protein